MSQPKLRIIPLGGLGEIGRNMMVVECDDDIIVIDCGVMFPKDEMLGVDLVIPDITYLLERQERVRGIIITHGHEDHTGALPYVLPRLNVPVYCSLLTHGLISVKLKEHRQLAGARLNIVQPGDTVGFGKLSVEFFHVCHSIPDALGLIIHTPLGTVVHTGDFKMDYTPVDGLPTDFARLASLRGEGVLLLFSDSTYAEVPGYTASEQEVAYTLERTMAEAQGRVIIATFASLISRMQLVLEAAARQGRRVFFVGRSMRDNVEMALKLGYLKAPSGLIGQLQELPSLAPEKVVIMTTGSQGEPTSALVRMAIREHPQVDIVPGDTVILSATPIPGNEHLVNRTLDNLFRLGTRVLYDKIAPVHVHGHGSQEELKMVIHLVNPRYFVPVHGEYRHLSLHAAIAQSLGMPPSNTFVLEDGDVLEMTGEGSRVTGRVPSGNVYVDGLSVGGVGPVVLRDRQALARDGMVVVVLALDQRTGQLVGDPDVASMGFVEMAESRVLVEETRKLVEGLVAHHQGMRAGDQLRSELKDALSRLYYEKTRRRPIILPFTLEV
ncbi:MAG: ribonuclease J [Chloroflexi bacterium]|nr:ribonuclease J [Chloroflexota bacterium]